MASPSGSKEGRIVEGLIGTAITALASLIAGGIGAFFLFRGKKVDQETEETKAEKAATAAFLDGQAAFQEYVEGVVNQRVSTAVAGLQAQLDELTEKLSGVQREAHEMNDAIRSRETQLWLWNIRNRTGPMPELPAPILKRLGIGHLTSATN
jgi:uncharacterized coiled-coil protein SlyX